MSGYAHRIRHLGGGVFELAWTWDKKYRTSRLRFPTTIRRVTEREGAERFAKKWGVPLPEPKP